MAIQGFLDGLVLNDVKADIDYFDKVVTTFDNLSEILNYISADKVLDKFRYSKVGFAIKRNSIKSTAKIL